MSFSRLLLASLIAYGLATYALGAAVLPEDEVKALRDIAKTLGKTDWNFSADPCGGQWGWANPNAEDGSENAVSCNCTFSNGTICHHRVLKNQNLQGSLPPDLSRFPYLQVIDLSRNYLNGTIPREWGATQMLDMYGNRFTGPIPKEIGNISTLVNFTVEFNQFSGVLPPELGNLSRLEKLHLTSNKFTGQLPAAFGKLTALKDFRIGDNQFTGEIPNLIQKWTDLQKLVIQGSGLSGPIPPGIAVLEKMTDLRISDLQENGTGAPFPPLANMTKLKTLILRSCNIIGRIPDFVGQFSSLKTLDLSFNQLDGEIPDSFLGVKKATYIDLSYNNFGNESSCQQRNIASMGNVSGRTVSCLRSLPCQKKLYSFHINCGGNAATIEGNLYEEDTDPAGPSRLYQKSNWAVSTTGHFIDDDRNPDSYIWTNATKLYANTSSLYMDARLSPVSLTYYGLCMESGNYTVSLHFAEIMFTNDNTSSSLGRRFFDIYIQGKLVQKNFSIQNEAGGVGKAIIKNFTAIVTGGALEIRFYWAGKGTTGLPVRGVYGPLISAISVTPGIKWYSFCTFTRIMYCLTNLTYNVMLCRSVLNPLLSADFKPPSENSGTGISAGTMVGIVAAAVVFVFLILGILWWKGCFGQKSSMRHDGTIIAVKQLSSKSKQGNREFVNEIGMISALQHPHLVKLHGCCIEGDQLLLVYEYMENNSLARALFGPEEYRLNLDWATRQKICVGIARGLAYLHEESRLKIVHRDIKATNVLLDENLDPKISDFGLARLDEEDNTHISTRVAGTLYLDYDMYLVFQALFLKEEGTLLELVDPSLGQDYNEEEVITMINVALLCSNVTAAVRPAMSAVVSMLEGKAAVKDFDISDKSKSMDEHKIKEMRKHFQVINRQEISETQTQSMSMDGPWTAASTSDGDLYPISLNSDYLKGRD
ncbi:hypothetical protein SADUNF_Sadunf16G0253100 [Salix dunnii]|uniref:non-specific serine/threonine protein kinase n=1 Tax=Salix dunnii TaxID=1413687 RepID=A0A835JBM6_9ROSI|nr:hypothetical protein SADUNF_Sadunf16G0253100 [Salix dunnii]